MFSTAVQPLYGQTANIFGRRLLINSAVILFMIGSAISGAATSMAMLITGRTVQGIGGGGCSMLIDMIICDLVPVRERGSVMGYIFGAATVCTALGPFIGGILAQKASWRWVFYINLPVAAAGLILLILFLHLEYDRQSSVMRKIKRVDFTGNAIFVAATTSLMIALTNAGTLHSWGSWHIILPLVLGIVGLGVFVLYELSPLCVEKTLSKELFSNRTSATAFLLTFLHTMFMYWEVYFMPVYFQAVKGSSPSRSGVQLLPTVINLMVWAGVGGGLMQAYGRYVYIHIAAFSFMTMGFGLLSMLSSSSSSGEWIVFQIIFAIGAGLPIGTLLPSAQAPLPEAFTASATGLWAVLRSFGTVWGITISAAIFNNRFAHLLIRISDPAIRERLSRGRAYEYGTRTFLESLQPETKVQVIENYQWSVKLAWQVGIGLAGLGLLTTFLQREVHLRTEIDTEFGIKDNST